MAPKIAVLLAVFLAGTIVGADNSSPVMTYPANNKMMINVLESEPVGKLIFNCSATDKDDSSTANGTLSYNFKIGNQERRFSMDAATCNIYVAQRLEYEKVQKYELYLQVTDGGGLSDNELLTINITDVNNNAPLCTPSLVWGSLFENATAFSSFANLSCSDVDTGNGKDFDFDVLLGSNSYTIGASRANNSAYTIRSVDYEGQPHSYTSLVLVTDRGTPQLQSNFTLILSVEDCDDNSPVINPVPNTGSVEENIELGYSVLKISATDADAPNTPASQITFESTCTPNVLIVDRYSGDLIVEDDIDYETTPVIKCKIFAFSDPSNKTSTDVTVTVTNKNDGIPTFQKAFYFVAVDENMSVGSTIVSVTATDPEKGTIKYTIEPAAVFDMNSNGAVTLKQSPDYESTTSYLATITATDDGNPTLSSTALLQVIINPLNEYAPDFGTSSCDGSVPENALYGTSVTSATAIDKDHGLDGVISYNIETSNVPFFVDKSSGVIGVAAKLDYEKVQSYTIKVSATDNSKTSQKTTLKTCTISVDDINDQSVQCSPPGVLVVKYPFPLSGPVTTINCSLANKIVPLTYKFEAGNDKSFDINTTTGELNLVQIPLQQQYYLNISATHVADTAYTTLIVLSETKLALTSLPLSINVTEEETGRKLTTVQACCAFPEKTFSISDGNADGRVTLTGSNGDLTLMVPYDREYQSQYIYQIQVKSKSGQVATSTLTVNVDDINDNAPVFSPDLLQVNVDATLAAQSVIESLHATDKDTGTNALFDFTIIAGNTGDTFSVEPLTGVLSLVKSLDYDTTNVFVLVITATDRGLSPLTGTTTVVVTVVDNRKRPPQFIPTGGPFTVTLSEDSALGMTVFQLQTNASGSKADFNIVSGNTHNAFQINKDSGAVIIVRRLDRETIDAYSLNVSATDQNGLSSFASVTVSITDVNDNSPVFSQQVLVFSVLDQTAGNYVVGLLNVTDPDLGPNGTVVLTIPQGNTAGAFRIDGSNLVTNIQMNYPVVNMYRLIVEAADQGTPSRKSTGVVVVFILNGNIPFFNISSDSISVLENKSLDSQIYDVNATGKGARENGSLTYSIDSGSLNFGIRSRSGQIVIIKELDYETLQTDTLTITARNTVKPSLSATFILTVTVLDVNEHAPQFSKLSFSFSVNEDANPNFSVGTVLAVDLDRRPSGQVTMTWAGPSDFAIDPQTGVITSKAALDYRARQSYWYILTAQDQGVPVLRSMASVVININDVNDHHPTFDHEPLDVEVPDSVPILCEIYQVRASDLDTGPAGNVSFEIVNQAHLFSIDSTTGIVQTQVHLDGTTTPVHLVTIRAFDAGNPVLDNITTLTVHVVATNPNYFDPVFDSNCPDHVTVERNAASGFIVLPCTAADKDTGNSGQVNYIIQSGNDDGYFVIDNNSGTVTTATNLLTARNGYTVVVLARDNGKPQRNTTKSLDITIRPALSNNLAVNYTFIIAENTPVTTPVGAIEVSDGRTVSSYTIKTGNYGDEFYIVSTGNKGQLYSKNLLDREVYSLYSLVLEATTDVDVLTIVVEVLVTDVNDNPPMFPYSVLDLKIAENSPISTSVEKVSYFDLDTDAVNRNNTLSIAPDIPLRIDQSGNLYLSSPLDYETQKHYSVVVVVTDNQPPFTTSSLPVEIDVIDVEEKEYLSTSDVTESALISLEVPHKASPGDLVYTLKPGDFGLTPSTGAVAEFVVYKGISPFSIHPRTGDITVNGQLSYHTMYFLWAMMKLQDGSTITNRTSLIRIDTYDKATEMIVIEFAESLSFVETNLQRFRSRAQEFFTPIQRIGFFSLLDTSTGSRRRLLVQKSAVYTYVVNNTMSDHMSNINEPKTFMTKQQILDVLQSSRDGSPVLGLSDPSVLDVATVEPFEEKSTSDSFDAFISSAAGIAVFCLLALLVLVLLALLVTCIFYRQCRGKETQVKKPKKKDSPKKRSFSRMSESPTFFSGSPQIIVSAPPPVTQHNPTPEKQFDPTPEKPFDPTPEKPFDPTPPFDSNNVPKPNKSPNNEQKQLGNGVNNDSASQNSRNRNNIKDPSVLNGLPSQYGNKNEKNHTARKE